ncbi:MAG: helix-turn-helix transcriptional regulator [Treponema sp.]|nr:helix-turn-helix transcriptional regulator [Treponema sp.]
MAIATGLYYEFKTVIEGKKAKIILSISNTANALIDLEADAFKYIHYHVYYELFLLNEQQSINIYTKSGIKNFKNCVLCIPPLLSHYAFSSNNTVVIALTFTNEKGNQIKPFNSKKITTFETTPLVSECIKKINGLSKSNVLSEGNQLQSLIQCIIYEIIDQEKSNKITASKKEIFYQNRLINFETIMCSEFLNNINIQKIAKKLFLSTRQLSRLIKDNYNKTFTQFLLEKRLEAACLLLQTTNFSVNEIAEKTNFLSPTYFYRTFKKYYKTTPLKYKHNKK